jgi:hypothetical protein
MVFDMGAPDLLTVPWADRIRRQPMPDAGLLKISARCAGPHESNKPAFFAGVFRRWVDPPSDGKLIQSGNP